MQHRRESFVHLTHLLSLRAEDVVQAEADVVQVPLGVDVVEHRGVVAAADRVEGDAALSSFPPPNPYFVALSLPHIYVPH